MNKYFNVYMLTLYFVWFASLFGVSWLVFECTWPLWVQVPSVVLAAIELYVTSKFLQEVLSILLKQDTK